MSLATVAHVSTFPPTQCGIATYTEALAASLTGWQSVAVPILFAGSPAPRAVKQLSLLLDRNSSGPSAHSELGAAITESSCDVVSLQHEFGIYGGRDGEYVVDLVSSIKKPVVTTLHTIAPTLSLLRQSILKNLVDYSTAVVVLSPQDASVLGSFAPACAGKICVIRHGVPDVPFSLPYETTFRRAFPPGPVFVSSGHVRPSKGYELAFRALALLKQKQKDFTYLILGCVQPQYEYGVQYRHELLALIHELGLDSQVLWREEYLSWPALVEGIVAADLGLVTYMDEEQASSGVLPLMLALGRPVVATRFAYAKRMSSEVPGIRLVGGEDARELCEALQSALGDRNELRYEMRRAYDGMRPYIWSCVGNAYDRVLRASMQHVRLSTAV